MHRRRNVLVHYHIYKNAGSSVDRLLAESFGERWATFEGAHGCDVVAAPRLQVFLEASPTVVAVSSHLARPPRPPGGHPIVFLRHPLVRALSVYRYARLDPHQPDHAIAREQGVAGYVDWALASDQGGNVIRDYQTIHLSDASFRADHIHHASATRADLEQALERLRRWGVFGLVDAFAESCRRLQARYQTAFPELRLHDVRLNRTAVGERSDQDQVALLQATLGPGRYRRLVEANALDLRLYEESCRLFAAG